MPTIQDRLKKVRQELALTQENLANELINKGVKITSRTITAYESGDRQPSVNYLEALVKNYDINSQWLLLGAGEMFVQQASISQAPANVNLGDLAFIPIINMNASAGHGSLISSEKETTKDYIAFTREWLSKITNTNPKYLVGFVVKGDSMQGEINDGDIIIVNTLNNEMSNDGTYAVTINDMMFVKRLQQRPGKEIKVISANPKYEPFSVDLNNDYFKIIGNVVWAGVRMDVC